MPLVGFPDLSVRVETSNQMAMFHGRLRAQRREGHVRPYVDALVGFNYISTTTSVDADEVCDNGSCDDDHGPTSTTWCSVQAVEPGSTFGFGAAPHTARLDIGVRNLYGGEADYLTKSGILWGRDPVGLEPHRSRTDMVMVYIGVAFGR